MRAQKSRPFYLARRVRFRLGTLLLLRELLNERRRRIPVHSVKLPPTPDATEASDPALLIARAPRDGRPAVECPS